MSSIESKFGEYFADLKSKGDSDDVFDKIIEAMQEYCTLYQPILETKDQKNVEFSVQQFFIDTQIIYSSIGEYFTISLAEEDSSDEDIDDHGKEVMNKALDTIKACERIVEYFGTLKEKYKNQSVDSFKSEIIDIDPVIKNDLDFVSNFFKEMNENIRETKETIEKTLKSAAESAKDLAYSFEKNAKFNEIKEKIQEIGKFCKEEFEKENDSHKQRIKQYALDLRAFMKTILCYWSQDNFSNESQKSNMICSAYTYNEWEAIDKVKINDFTSTESKELCKNIGNVNLKDTYLIISKESLSLASLLQKN
jgi:hypothetical protein